MIDGWAADDVTPPAFLVTTDDAFCKRLRRERFYHDHLDKAAEEIEEFLEVYNFDDPGENHRNVLFGMQWRISSLNARLMAKLTERYGEDK